jgi:multiple sugar transport system permease protein
MHLVSVRRRSDVATVPSAAVVAPAGRHFRRRMTPYLFLLAPLTLLVVFTYVPVVNMFWYSFTDWDGLDKHKEYVGFENYVDIFTRRELFGVFKVSLYYFVGAFVQMGLALYFATVLSFNVRFKNLFKGMLFFPYLINGVAIAFVFLYFFRPGGVLDEVLEAFRLGSYKQQWLGDRTYVNYSLASVSVWRYMGLNFVLFLGAIQSIPSEQFEAAQIDGATRWQQFRFIIAPGIKPVISLCFILAIAGALSVFEIPFVMLAGANGSKTFVIQTVQTAFQFHKFGLASAMAVVLLLMILIVTWVQRRIVPDRASDLV